MSEAEYAKQRFAAALQGHNLDEDRETSDEDWMEQKKREAAAKLAGLTQDEYDFAEIGFGYAEDEE